MNSDTMRSRVLVGISWNASARIAQQIIQFSLSVLLARLLTPEDFGTVGLIAVFVGFAGLFVDVGFGSAIVQRKEITEQHLNSVFWMSIGLSGFIAMLLVILAPLVSQFYQQPELTPLVRFSAINFLIIPFGMVPTALMQKSMSFNRLARIEIVSTLFSGILCASLALMGWGVWSLLAQSLALNLGGALLKWRVSRWTPKMMFTYAAFRDLWDYSINLLGFNFINYWARNGDNLLIGRLLGSAALGIYSRAYSLMLLPISQMMSVVASVMFSALASVQDDKPRVKRIYLEAVSRMSFFIFPIMIGLSAIAEPFIITVYGEKWAGVIPILRILAVVGLFQSIMNPVGWLYTSQGETRLLFWWGFISAGLLIFSIIVGVLLGSLVTISLCYALANIILFYPAIVIPGRFIDMSFGDLMKRIYQPLVISMIMGIVVWLWLQTVQTMWASGIVLFSAILIGMFTYFGLAIAWKIPTAYQTLELLRARLF